MYGAKERYSLGINVNTPFFQVPTLEFGHGAGARPCTQAQTWAPGSCAHNLIFVSSGQSIALFWELSSCFKIASDGAKWSNYRVSQKFDPLLYKSLFQYD